MADHAQAMPLISSVGVNRSSSAPAEAAFDDWIRLHYEEVYRFAYRILGESEEACDVTQECFVRAFRTREKFRGECSPRTWLMRIAINLCRDLMRKRRRTQAVFACYEEEVPADLAVTVSPPDLLALDVKRCMQELPEEQRIALVLRFVDGYSFAELGDALGCTEAAAKMKVHRAKERLRRLLEGGDRSGR